MEGKVYDNLCVLFESFLGQSYRGVNERGQAQFACPFCNSPKKNLEVNFHSGIYHSWCCPEMSGSVFRLINRFGGKSVEEEYRAELERIGILRLYEISFLEAPGTAEKEDRPVVLPAEAVRMNEKNGLHVNAFEYLKKRGIDSAVISEWDLHCTPPECENRKIVSRIIIPSRNREGKLNYWVGRSYMDTHPSLKYVNCEAKRKNIIFGEDRIQNFYSGDIRLVEGPFDAFVIPCSIPVLGKKISKSFYLYRTLMQKAASVTLVGDGEALREWENIYKLLDRNRLHGKVFMCTLPENEDPSSIYSSRGRKGIISILASAHRI